MKKCLFVLCALLAQQHLASAALPTITTEPANTKVGSGTNAILQVAAAGATTYQWQLNGTNLVDNAKFAGSTTASLTIFHPVPSDYPAGFSGYGQAFLTCVVGNATNSVTSSPAARLEVTDLPIINTIPGQTNNVGDDIEIEAEVDNTVDDYFQWRRNLVPLPGQNGQLLELPNAQVAYSGVYDVVVTNAAGSVTSSPFVVLVESSCATQPSGLVSWWKADGDYTDSVGGNNGTSGGGFVTGEVGGAFGFGGDSEVQTDTAGLPTGNSPRTIELWVYRDSNSAAYNNALLAGYGNFPGESFCLTMTNGTLAAGSLSGALITSASVPISVWHHVVATFDGSQLTIYLDGSILMGPTIWSFNTPANGTCFIGGLPDTNHNLSGGVDDVRIYNRALTSTEVAAIYAAGANGVCSASTVSVLTDYLLVKGQQYVQTNANPPVLQSGTPYVFQAEADFTSQDAMNSASIKLPAGTIKTLTAKDSKLNFNAAFASLTALNGAYPNNPTTPYAFRISTDFQGSNSVSMLLPADTFYPSAAPHISNANDALSMDAMQPFTFTWDAYPGGAATNFVIFSIADGNGNKVISSGDIGSGNLLPGTATQFLLPANTLMNGVTYKVSLLFAQPITFTTANFSGSLGLSGYFKETDFSFTPVSSDHGIITHFGMAKGIESIQTGNNALTVPTNGYHFDVFVDTTGNDAATNGFLKLPNGTTNFLTGGDDNDHAGYDTNFSTQAALNTAFPAGRYNFTLQTTYAGTKTSTLILPSDSYPNTPHFLNYDQIRYMNADLDFTFSWDPFISTSTNDFIELDVLDPSGDDHIDTVHLSASATSYVLTGGSTPRGDQYTVQLRFVHVISTDTNTLPGATGFVGYIKQTDVTYTTLSSDLRYYSAGKGQLYAQSSPAAPGLSGSNPYVFRAAISELHPGAQELSSGNILTPSASSYTMCQQSQNSDPGLLYNGVESSQGSLDFEFQDGTYQISANVNGNNFSGSASITGDTYPNAPHVSNYGQAQVINPGLDFTLRWDAFAGGTTNDVIQVVIRDTNGYPLYQSAVTTGESATILDGTATSLTIPAFSLPSGQPAVATLTFTKITDFSSSSGIGGRSLIGYFAETAFPVSTLSSAGLFPVATTSAREYSTSSTFDGDNYVVGFLGKDNEVNVQFLNPAGNPLGPVLDLDGTGTTPPLVGYDSCGNYMAVWTTTDPIQVVSSAKGVSAQGGVLTPTVGTGNTHITGQVNSLINHFNDFSFDITSTNGSPVLRGMAYNGHRYLVVWEDSSTGTNTLIYGQLLNSNGGTNNNAFLLASGRDQKLPTVASDGNKFLVAWQSKDATGKWNVVGCIIDDSPTVGAQFNISQTNSATAGVITATGGTTNYLVAWSRDTSKVATSSSWDLFGRTVASDGTVSKKEFAISTTANDQVLPYSAYDGSAYLVDWMDVNSAAAPNGNAQIKAKFVSPSGGGDSPEFALFQSFRNKMPTGAPVLFDGSRYFIESDYSTPAGFLAGNSDSDIYATFLSVTTPVILANPANKFVAIGDTIALSAAVSGQPPLQYQWAFNGTNLAGATDTNLRITNASPANAGSYTMTVLNTSGSATTAPGVVVVLAKPLITAQPVGATNVATGSPYAFSVTATGGVPLTYQWRLNGTTIPGATGSTYTVNDVELNNSGIYSVAVQNPVGAVNSIRTLLLATGQSLAQYLGDNFPGAQTNSDASGSGFGSNVGATREPGEPIHGGKVGGGSVWFNWQAPADGVATFSTLGSSFDTLIAVYVGDTLTNLTRLVGDDDSGGFFASQVSFNATNGVVYHIAIDGRAGATGNIVLSWSLLDVVGDVPTIIYSPSNQTAVVGQPVDFTVTAQSPSGNLNYQWYFNGNPIGSATSSTLHFDSASTGLAGQYYVIVSSAVSAQSVTSPSATLEINSAANTKPSEDKFSDILSGDATLVAYKPHFSRNPKGELVPVSAGAVGTQLMNNFGATKEDGEPDHAGVAGGSSRWFSLEALDNGTMIVDTIGSDFDTVLAVYTGTNLLTLKTIASDDNSAPDGVRSQCTFTATNGVTYLVAIDGVNGVQGNIVLNWRLGNLPVITQSLTNKLVKAGTNVFLTIAATNDPVSVPISYQWQYNGANIPGATDPSLAINNFQTGNAGAYRAQASNYVGIASTTGILAAGPPTVNITAPVTGLYTKGPTNLVVSAASFGLDLTNLTFFQGTTKIGTRTNLPYSFIWSNVAAGIYNITARGMDKLGQIGTSAVVRVVVDTAKPTVAITLPAKGARSTNANVTVSGTATDNNGTGQIIYKLNSDAPVTLALTTNKWSVPVVCTPGTNTFVIQAVDLAGNLSVPATNNFFYVVSNLFTLNITGNGTVTKNFTGNMLELGRGYQLTAKPLNAQNVFSNWDGYQPSSNNLVLNFTMSPGLVITANFVNNPFPALAGTYNGLYYETNQVKLISAGLFTFTLTGQGALSGKLVSGTPLTIAGSFDASGLAVISIPRTKQSNLVANIQLDIANHSDVVSGTLVDPGWTAVLDGDRALTNASAVSGNYVVTIPGDLVNISGSGAMGSSFATTTVKTNGALTMTAQLADGTTTAAISESTGIARNGRWPLYASLYTGKGMLIGWVNLTNQGTTTVTGDINWIKSTNSPVSKFYPLGFTNDTAAAGSIFAVTNKTSFLNSSNGTIVLSGGNLSVPITNTFTWDSNNVVKAFSLSNAIVVPSTNKLTLTVTPATGQFTGTFIHPATKASTKISGGLLQQSNNGSGFFPGTNQTGNVNIQGN